MNRTPKEAHKLIEDVVRKVLNNERAMPEDLKKMQDAEIESIRAVLSETKKWAESNGLDIDKDKDFDAIMAVYKKNREDFRAKNPLPLEFQEWQKKCSREDAELILKELNIEGVFNPEEIKEMADLREVAREIREVRRKREEDGKQEATKGTVAGK